MSEQQENAVFEELDLLFTEDAFWISKSIEKKLARRSTKELKSEIELIKTVEQEITEYFEKNSLWEITKRRDIIYGFPLTRETREKFKRLFATATVLIVYRNDTHQKDIQKVMFMLNSEEDFPEYELAFQFKRWTSEEKFFLKRVYVTKRDNRYN